MFLAKLFPAFIIFVLANTVAAQQKQGDFDLLCEGERVTTIGVGIPVDRDRSFRFVVTGDSGSS